MLYTVRQQGLVTSYQHPRSGTVKVIASAVRHSEISAAIHRPAPLVGRHPREILREFDHSDAESCAWMASGVAYDDSDV
ncbi:hypothetical protein [Rhizobium sp.]